MVIDADNTNISYVVIETGGFLDLGDKTVLVPWNSLELQADATGGQQNAFILNVDAEMLNNAPDVDLQSVLPERGQAASDWDADIRNFWEGGAMPSATQATGDGTATEAPTEAATEAATEAPTEATTGAATAAPGSGIGTGQGGELQGVLLVSEVLGSTIMFGQGTGTGTATEPSAGTGTDTGTTQPTAQATTDPGTGGAQATATTDAGAGTGTGTGTGTAPTEGTVEDIIVDPDTGDILFLVLSSMFDDGDRWIPVPLSMMRWDTTNQSLMFGGDASMLQNAPFFAADQFPDPSTEGWDTDFNDFWQNNGGSGTGSGSGADATATP
jgi:hypothetical protein